MRIIIGDSTGHLDEFVGNSIFNDQVQLRWVDTALELARELNDGIPEVLIIEPTIYWDLLAMEMIDVRRIPNILLVSPLRRWARAVQCLPHHALLVAPFTSQELLVRLYQCYERIENKAVQQSRDAARSASVALQFGSKSKGRGFTLYLEAAANHTPAPPVVESLQTGFNIEKGTSAEKVSRSTIKSRSQGLQPPRMDELIPDSQPNWQAQIQRARWLVRRK